MMLYLYSLYAYTHRICNITASTGVRLIIKCISWIMPLAIHYLLLVLCNNMHANLY